ncbi:MAG: flagellar protein FlgN [Clostridiales bacterium]|nr:flagellar protein FlgN [Clostridiales bacterium]
MSEISAFLTATERCVAQCKSMLAFEQEKRQALLADDLTRLESMIQAQQAAIMRLESLEKQRMEAQEKAGYQDMRAEEILERMGDGPEKEALARQVGELKQTMEEIRYQNDKAMEIARANLQIVNTLAPGGEQKDRQGVYRPKQAGGADWQSGSSSFETKI